MSAVKPRLIPVRALLLLFLSALVAGGCASQPVEGIPEQVMVPLVYVTDRNINEGARPSRFYGGERGEPQTGLANVAVSTRGDDVSPFADWHRWTPKPGRSRDRNELIDVLPTGSADVAGIVVDSAARIGANVALVYIHGFRRRFDASAINFARLLYQVSPNAVPVLYSWPSTGNVFRYKDDVSNLEWSNGTLDLLLTQLLDAPEIETIHVIAHSLGSVALLEAVAAIAERSPAALRTRFGQVLLVSPDIARPRFEQDYLPLIHENGLAVTIYAAENDVPLRTSRRVNKTERVGDAKQRIPLYPGIETILVSDVVSILNSHDAHLEVVEVQTDMAYLINTGLAADDRPTLERIDAGDGVYWRISAGAR